MDYLYKILLVGDTGAGKSCLLMRYVDDTFTRNYISTIGVDFKVRGVDVDGKRVKLQIWDTSGQDRFRDITNTYYRGARGIILVYDVTNMDSWHHIDGWYNEAKKLAGDDTVFLLVGNKSDDVNRVVPYKTGFEYSVKMNMLFIETSALTGDGIVDGFYMFVKMLMCKKSGGAVEYNNINVLTGENNRHSAGCCPIL